jgi:hypothetical protein
MRFSTLALGASLSLFCAFVARPAVGGGCTATPNVEAVGTGSAGASGVPALEGVGTPIAGTPGTFRFRVRGAMPYAPGVLLLARLEAPVYSGTFETTLWTSPFFVPFLFQCDENGEALVSPGPTTAALDSLCGLDLIGQASIFDPTGPGGSTWTNGLRFRFGGGVLGD